jgi:hypothetical protein
MDTVALFIIKQDERLFHERFTLKTGQFYGSNSLKGRGNKECDQMELLN